MVDLETKLKLIISNIERGVIDKEVIGFKDSKNKYTYLKNSVIVKVCLVDGKEADIDVTEYFYK